MTGVENVVPLSTAGTCVVVLQQKLAAIPAFLYQLTAPLVCACVFVCVFECAETTCVWQLPDTH